MPETKQKPPCECGHGPHADVVGDGAAECLETDCACDAYPNPSPPAPAGWPSDEAIARAIRESFLSQGTLPALGVAELGAWVSAAAAVQRLYAPLRERLARYEAATEDTPENRAAVLTAYFGTYTPEDLDRTPGKCAAKVLAHLRRVAQGEEKP